MLPKSLPHAGLCHRRHNSHAPIIWNEDFLKRRSSEINLNRGDMLASPERPYKLFGLNVAQQPLLQPEILRDLRVLRGVKFPAC